MLWLQAVDKLLLVLQYRNKINIKTKLFAVESSECSQQLVKAYLDSSPPDCSQNSVQVEEEADAEPEPAEMLPDAD